MRNEFLTAARGFTGLPVHYPRVSTQSTLESFKWFDENDRVKGKQLSLGELDDRSELPLPYWPSKAEKKRGRSKHQSRPPQNGGGSSRRGGSTKRRNPSG